MPYLTRVSMLLATIGMLLVACSIDDAPDERGTAEPGGVAPDATVQPVAASGATLPYSDDDLGVSLRYPEDWFVSHTPFLFFTSTEDFLDGTHAGEEGGILVVVPQHEAVLIAADLAKVTQDFSEEFVIVAEPIYLVQATPTSVNGLEAVTLTVRGPNRFGDDYTVVYTMIHQTGQLIATVAAAPTAVFEDFRTDFGLMVASIDVEARQSVAVQTLPAVPGPTVLPETNVDLTDPVAVVQAIFDAAQTEDFTDLSSLCDPLGENDADSAQICGLAPGRPDVAIFVGNFARGSVNGAALIEGDKANVPILFGPEGTIEESVELVLRNGSWYLFDF